MSTSRQLSTVLTTIKDAILADIDGAELSPTAIDIERTPGAKLPTLYAIDAGDPENTGEYSDRDLMRWSMPVSVSFAQPVKMLDQLASYQSALDRAEGVIRAVGNAMAYGPTRVEPIGIQHAKNASGELHVVTVQLRVGFDFYQPTHTTVM